ncbi:MAG: DNA internalization-related competence protein ComEC/Rec2 [Lachnospiraceae bacterium]|nr:DNA internalization-related competence protein ComEC/Rec2 [Lachnospiraceae bacterium]
MKNRPLFYVFAGVILGEGCYCISKIMAGAVAAFCLILIICQRQSCDFLYAHSRLIAIILRSFLIGFLIGVFALTWESPLPESGTQIEGEIRGKIVEVGTGKTEVIRLSPFCVNGKQMSGSLLLYGETKDLLPGQKIVVTAKIQAYESPRNPGQFDLRQYYRCRGIYYHGFFDSVTMVDRKPNWWKSQLYFFKKLCVDKLRKYLSEQDAGILCAAMLGEKSYLDSDIKELYQKNGIAHILAISGLHLSMIGGAVYKFLKRIGLSFFTSGMISFLVIIPYCIMIGNAVAALRAMIMLILLIGADIKGRGYDFLSSASLAGILILGESPYYLFDAGFLLSFGAIFAIGCVNPCFYNWKKGKQLWLGLSIWFVLLPIQLWFFYEISPSSIFLNFLVIPVMPFLLFFGFVGLCTPFVACFSVCHMILKFYESLLVFPSFIFGKPQWYLIALYLLMLSICCYYIRQKKRVHVLFCTMIAMACLFLFQTHGFQITFLDVGQGDCILISSPTGHHYMIDGGSSSVSEVGKYRIIPFLKSQGIKSLDYVIITHFDEDHYSGVEEMLGSYPIRNLMIFQNVEKTEQGYQRILALAKKSGVTICECSRGTKLKDGAISLECQFPQKDYQAEKNQQSLVFLLRYKEVRCLFTGDLELEGEADFLKMNVSKAEVLKVGHHGSKNATSEELLKKVEPDFAVISCGKNNRYGHPNAETLQRLQDAGCQITSTVDVGAIWIKENHHQLYLETFQSTP